MRKRLIGVGWFTFVLIFLSSMITSAFYITDYIYKITNWRLPILLSQIFNTLLGLLFAGALFGVISKFARSKGWLPERNVFRPIIEAMERIARGDFSVRLEDEIGDHQMVGELARSVNNMALELDQMENMRQEFVSNVSHEIQSPLTSIRGFTQALKNDLLSPEERHHYLGIIENESTRLSRITEDLLKLASLESDRVRFEPKPYHLDKQIRSLILTCEPQWAAKGIDMDVSLEEVEIVADQDLLSQVWLNLINNAIKFSPQGGKVHINLCRTEGKIEFAISDTGIGISAEDQVHIFERFYKADKSRTRVKEGSGLGLSIVKKIVDMHKGTVEVKSKPGEGATFTVCLPRE
jgi:signal transduction histidine kinase